MMRTVIPADELLNKARAIGQYYGFTPLGVLTAEARGKIHIRTPFMPPEDMVLDPIAELMVNFLKQFRATEHLPSPRQPVFVWHTNIALGRPTPKKAVIQFHALGADRAIADAVVIRALLALTRDLFHEDFSIRINSMGDKETRARYVRELAMYFKKRGATLSEEYIVCARRDAFEAAELVIASERGGDDLPAPTEHLSDASRKRFEDLLEYLEMTETPYELARDLLSKGGAWSDACFEVVAPGLSAQTGLPEQAGRRLAWGSRYSDLVRHFFPATPFSATGAVLQIACEGEVTAVRAPGRLRFSFIHIGDEAKRLSIRLAEEFRRARLPLSQHIGIESLTEQLRIAEKRNSPYLLIMGRKEALENTAILRNRATQEETILPVNGLAERLRTFA